MVKHVKVRFVGVQNQAHSRVLRDCSVGTVYDALFPEKGMMDKDGLPVIYDDELWLEADDAGDAVVCLLSDGFVVVEELC